ncbi:MAG TPA: hypothetical protein VI997_07375, partial [Candidatus Thermoplasmatota archaeon]|nr:hypothetical protein [Candidatus Thermoplasmatota archaeon]
MRPPALALALLLPLVPGAAAADLEVGGTLAIDEDLVVGAGDTLRLLSGTLVTGPGRLVVHGRLVAEGTPEAPVRFTTRVVLAENASADLVDARFLGASGRALEIDRAAARIVRLVLEGGDEGIFVRDGSLRLHGARVTGLGGAG